MAQNSQILDFKSINQICAILENIIRHSIGPRGSKTLLATETGQVIITSDGKTVLRKLHFSHPIARLVIDSMTRMVNFTGDGSKTFILYLSQLCKGLEKYENRRSCVGRNSYVFALQQIKQEITEKLANFIENKIPDIKQDWSREICQKLSRSCLSNCFPVRIGNHFVTLMDELIGEDFENFQEHIENISDNFGQICVKIPNLPYSESKTMPPFIIQRKFTVYNPNTSNDYVKFVICMFPITGHPKDYEKREIIQLKSELTMIKFMDHYRLLLKTFVEICKYNGVNLILCADQVSDHAQQLLEASGINIINYVSEEDCEWLLCNLKISPCTSILERFEDHMFCNAKSCTPLIINGHQCVHLNLEMSSRFPKMLLLSAPTEGLCNQVSENLQKYLKCLLTCFSKDYCKHLSESQNDGKGKYTKRKVAVVAGGGTFEFLTSEFLSEFAAQNCCLDVNLMCNLLGKALLELPKILFHNNSPTKKMDLKSYLSSLEEIGKSKCVGKYLGFNRNGRAADLFSDGVLEPLEMKIHVLLSMIELAQQILHVDSIIGVKKIKQEDQSNSMHLNVL